MSSMKRLIMMEIMKYFFNKIWTSLIVIALKHFFPYINSLFADDELETSTK